MPPMIFPLVLFGAALHAGWNAFVKSEPDTELATAIVAGGAALLSALALPFLPFPLAGSWPYMAASVVLQFTYYLLLAATYRTGDMSHSYPIMRGTAPALTAAASSFLIGEELPPAAWTGILLICGGILGLVGRRGTRLAPATIFALANAVVIAGYTVVDGTGARLSGSAVAYTMWIFLLTGLPLVLSTWARRRSAFASEVRRKLPQGLIGGACTLGAYGIALWAMTLAPIAIVAALRETSIIFGTAISSLVLGERVHPARYFATCMIALGAIMMRLA